MVATDTFFTASRVKMELKMIVFEEKLAFNVHDLVFSIVCVFVNFELQLDYPSIKKVCAATK